MAKQEKPAAFTLRLSEEVNAKLEQLAKDQRRSKTAVIEVLIMAAR